MPNPFENADKEEEVKKPVAPRKKLGDAFLQQAEPEKEKPKPRVIKKMATNPALEAMLAK